MLDAASANVLVFHPDLFGAKSLRKTRLTTAGGDVGSNKYQCNCCNTTNRETFNNGISVDTRNLT